MRVLIVVLLMLTACKPSSQIDVDPLLIQQGDLPAGVVAGQIRDDTPIDDPPNVSRVSYQEFVHDGAVSGGVTVAASK